MKRLKSTGVALGATAAGSERFGVIDRNRRTLALIASAGAVISLLAVLAVPAKAAPETFDVAIPINTIVFAAEGSVTQVASIDIDPQFAGQICDVTARSENQASVHPGNDLVVSSDSSEVTIPNVEGQAGGTVDAQGTLVLGSQVVVSLVMGPDGVFSAGMNVHLVCDLPPSSTTTTIATTTTMATTTTTAGVLPTEVTTTTVPTEVLPTEITTTTAQSATSTSVTDEVQDTEVLPFTGVDGGGLALLAMALFGLGAALLVTAREREN